MEEKKRLGTIKENEVLVQRKKDIIMNNATQTITVPFRIIDQPLKLQPNEWYVFYHSLLFLCSLFQLYVTIEAIIDSLLLMG